jgi:hypothetical protein
LLEKDGEAGAWDDENSGSLLKELPEYLSLL